MSERGKDLAADVFHLISAHEVVPTRWATPCYFAVCGAVVETASMVVGTGCPNECEFTATMAYCPDCVRAAIELNNRAGVGDAVTGCRGRGVSYSNGTWPTRIRRSTADSGHSRKLIVSEPDAFSDLGWVAVAQLMHRGGAGAGGRVAREVTSGVRVFISET